MKFQYVFFWLVVFFNGCEHEDVKASHENLVGIYHEICVGQTREEVVNLLRNSGVEFMENASSFDFEFEKFYNTPDEELDKVGALLIVAESISRAKSTGQEKTTLQVELNRNDIVLSVMYLVEKKGSSSGVHDG